MDREVEIKFLSLPSVEKIKHELSAGCLNPKKHESLIRRYRELSYRVMLAQRRAAVIAAEVVRPGDFKSVHQEYRMETQIAREKFEHACVAIFSETCTKGL